MEEVTFELGLEGPQRISHVTKEEGHSRQKARARANMWNGEKMGHLTDHQATWPGQGALGRPAEKVKLGRASNVIAK